MGPPVGGVTAAVSAFVVSLPFPALSGVKSFSSPDTGDRRVVSPNAPGDAGPPTSVAIWSSRRSARSRAFVSSVIMNCR